MTTRGALEPQCIPLCPQGKSTLEVVAPWITWALVLLGWVVVHLLNVRRARREADFAALRAIENRIFALRSASVDYYTKPTSDDADGAIAGHIKAELQSIVRHVRQLRNHEKASGVREKTMEWRRSLTGGDFESANRKALSADDALVRTIWLTSDALVQSIRDHLDRTHRWF